MNLRLSYTIPADSLVLTSVSEESQLCTVLTVIGCCITAILTHSSPNNVHARFDYCRGLNNYQYHFEVHLSLRYHIL